MGNNTNLQARGTYIEEYDFYVDDETAYHITYGNYESYTFAINRDQDNGLVENLLLSKQADGSYKASIVSYNLDEADKESIKDGNLPMDIASKTTLSRLGSGCNGCYIFQREDGSCYWNKVDAISIEGAIKVTKVEIPCPEHLTNSVTEDGSGGVGSTGTDSGGTDTDNGAGTDSGAGTDNPNTENGTDPNAPFDGLLGGGNTNTDNDSTNTSNTDADNSGTDTSNENSDCLQPDENGNCVNEATIPLIVREETLTSCNQLKKLSHTDEFSANINPIVIELRTKTALSNEYAIDFRKNINGGEEYNFPDSNGIQEGESKTESGIKIGSVWFGGIHTHPVGTYPMFTWTDVNRLRDVYQGLHSDFTKEDVFIMIVNHDGTVYAIKIDDIATLIVKLDAELLNTKGDTEQEKEVVLNEIMQREYKKDSNNERAFLKKFNTYGIGLYKANDQNLSNWSRLELDDPTATNPNVNPIPCN